MIHELMVGVHEPTGARFPVECISDDGLQPRNVRIAATDPRVGIGAGIALDLWVLPGSHDWSSVVTQVSLDVVDPITGTAVHPQVLNEQPADTRSRSILRVGLTLPLLAVRLAPPIAAVISVTRGTACPR